MPLEFAQEAYAVFERATHDYHKDDHVDAPLVNPYDPALISYTLYAKNWIDAVQWHLEDIVRDPSIDPVKALGIKRRIDHSNQERTDMVEAIDTYFRERFADVKPLDNAQINTESPAWALDRLSILALKIYHMQAEVNRTDASADHIAKCKAKLDVLIEQRDDLMAAINQLLTDISEGKKRMKVYRQMKMYNDPDTNPVLYGSR